MEAIYAIDAHNGLSKNGTIPWKSKRDLQFFKNKTLNNVVIMGKNTYNSLPKSVRPLCNRLNIVLTNNAEQYSEETKDNPNVIFTNDDTIHTLIQTHRDVFLQSYPFLCDNFKDLKNYNGTANAVLPVLQELKNELNETPPSEACTIANLHRFKIFIIGGKSIYEQFIPLCNTVWVTKLKESYDCDLFMDYDFTKEFNTPEIVEESNELTIYKYTKTNNTKTT